MPQGLSARMQRVDPRVKPEDDKRGVATRYAVATAAEGMSGRVTTTKGEGVRS
jgi:hypothetical protein